MSETILSEVDQAGVVYLSFNRPEVCNAASLDMLDALLGHLLRIETDAGVRCVVLRGAGAHFMAGGDINAFAAISESSARDRRAAFEQRLARSALIFSVLQRLPQPVLACVRGAAAGAGIGFLLSCDLAVASSGARFVLSHVKLGLSPDGSSSYHLPRSIGMKRAKQMALLAEAVDAQTALDWGLVNWVVDEGNLESETDRIARQLARGAPRSLALAKSLLNRSSANTLAQQLYLEGQTIGLCAETEDFVEGARAFLGKRSPVFRGSAGEGTPVHPAL